MCNFSFPPSPPSSLPHTHFEDSSRECQDAPQKPRRRERTKKRSEGRTEAPQHSLIFAWRDRHGSRQSKLSVRAPSVVTPDDNAEETCTPAGPPTSRARQPFPADKRHSDPVLVVELGAPSSPRPRLPAMVPSAVLLQELAAAAGSRVARSYTIIDLSIFSLTRALRAVGARGNYWSTSSHAPPAYRSSSRSSLCPSGPLPSWRLRLCNSAKTFLDHAFKPCRTSLR